MCFLSFVLGKTLPSLSSVRKLLPDNISIYRRFSSCTVGKAVIKVRTGIWGETGNGDNCEGKSDCSKTHLGFCLHTVRNIKPAVVSVATLHLITIAQFAK